MRSNARGSGLGTLAAARLTPRSLLSVVVLLTALIPSAQAAEHITLRNGFELDCAGQTAVGDRVRLYMTGEEGGYLEVAADAIVRVEPIADALPPIAPATVTHAPAAPLPALAVELTWAEMHEMLAHAGAAHHIDEDLLASVVRAESGGQVRAVSRTGARGLMQLMPETASELGVQDSFQPAQNIAGGTAYLDGLLRRYHDNAALALAAYNAGPAAVDRYRGVPPYRETRAYVARVIREFNRRKQMELIAKVQ